MATHEKGDAGDTRGKILALADDLVRRRGYNAFSYKDISEALRIKPAAVHYHFPTKEDLGETILHEEIERFTQSRENWKSESPKQQMAKLVDIFKKSRGRGHICLMGSFCPDKDTLPQKMQAQLESLCQLILDWVADLLEAEGLGRERAPVIMATLMSSLILARVQGDAIFDTIITQLEREYIL